MLDLDVYAPSLQAYFAHTPKRWINDLLLGDADVSQVMVDMTPAISGLGADKVGKLWVGFSNPQKEEIFKVDSGLGKDEKPKLKLLSKFIQLRESLISDFDSDFILIDTSPGIRFWSINSLAIADILLLTLKFGELDIDGTRRMAAELYRAFEEFGAKPFLLLNRVNGYCVPHPSFQRTKQGDTAVPAQFEETEPGASLSREIGMDMISAIPCYCDIQFDKKEFLTVLRHRNHPFAEKLEQLAARFS
jgi:cellulose biosynthesis protein BcsQ